MGEGELVTRWPGTEAPWSALADRFSPLIGYRQVRELLPGHATSVSNQQTDRLSFQSASADFTHIEISAMKQKISNFSNLSNSDENESL